MPAYHSSFLNSAAVSPAPTQISGMALLPLKSKAAAALPSGINMPGTQGPAPLHTDQGTDDIVDEAISVYRANCMFRNFEILGPADRTLIYALHFVGDCLGKTASGLSAARGVLSQRDCQRMLYTHALSSFCIPGDPGFSLNAFFPAPSGRAEADTLRGYLGQLRLEIAVRLTEKMYQGNLNLASPTSPSSASAASSAQSAPSKWWMGFARRKFMNKAL